MPVAFAGMFIRQCYRTKNVRRHASWALVESHRTATEPRQRGVAWLGKLDEAGRLGIQHAADEARKSIEPADATERLQPLGRQRRFGFDDDWSATQPRWVEVNAGAVRVENLRQSRDSAMVPRTAQEDTSDTSPAARRPGDGTAGPRTQQQTDHGTALRRSGSLTSRSERPAVWLRPQALK